MNLTDLNKVALALVAPGKGILAADESSGTIKKRFDAIGVDSNPDSRRDYREMLFRSKEAMSKYISGVILPASRSTKVRRRYPIAPAKS